MDFRGFDSSIININCKGWNSHVHRGFPGKSESSNLSRDNVSREIGRTLLTSLVQSIIKDSEVPRSLNLRIHVSKGTCSHDQAVFAMLLKVPGHATSHVWRVHFTRDIEKMYYVCVCM